MEGTHRSAPEFADYLTGVDEYSHLKVIYWLPSIKPRLKLWMVLKPGEQRVAIADWEVAFELDSH